MSTRIKAASLDLIAVANGKPTGDALREDRRQSEAEDTAREIAAIPKFMNSRQRKVLRRRLGVENLADAVIPRAATKAGEQP